ncbi:Nitrogen fixation regulation protein FixK [Rhodobacteraceae bacterium THAF1]|uniref:transcriptional regulator FnrL n=1 Tax=Palleronia sp. THAF1 TaxID=2587842 RepID=UPI000F3DEDD4|nr:Crp/Fnr family transcriptional regulator [Palleronia sp. THAF1]QFU08799.1 Nitrogen fixation regulation protein FixK [Palleronia sp. THAF1]VDC23934.1 Nitrogen fixation regulation protein FixK [Rhodobacteraceae bacterium THAF1]
MAKLTPIIACSNCPIRHSAVCAECDAEELEKLASIKTYKTVPAGASLAEAGERLDHFSSIVSGCASMSRTLEDGRRQTVGLLLPSDYIGRPGRSVAAFDVEALSDVTLCRFERGAFEKLLRDTPHVATRLLTMTLDELDAARDWAVVLGRMTAREKVAAFLVSLVRRQAVALPSATGTDLHLPLSREAIADHLGLTIETTSRQFTALRKEGLIELVSNRDIRIPDFDALAIEAGDDGDGGPIV